VELASCVKVHEAALQKGSLWNRLLVFDRLANQEQNRLAQEGERKVTERGAEVIDPHGHNASMGIECGNNNLEIRGVLMSFVFTTMARGHLAVALAVGLAVTSSAQTTNQPELKSAKIEFLPGERTIFYDDFSDMAPDEPPPHWKVREGKIELRTGGNVRELYQPSGDNSASIASPKMVVPSNFTFELSWTGTGEMIWCFRDKDGGAMFTVTVRGEEDGQTASVALESQNETLGDGTTQTDTSKPVMFGFWAQQGRVRAYINGERLVDVNQVQFNQIVSVDAELGRYRPNGIRSVRIAESAPDFSSVINSTGKYVTHGIYFDTDSDRLKPESGAVLKQVAAGLQKNPNLKLQVIGYTDSAGNAAHNLDLSKRRAQAVASVLTAQFGIDASRLSVNGFGADKPIASNDTADGRAANRRVEFVKN
jgi:OmpA-OmpF porin, OOP family